MLSVVIPTADSEPVLVRTLASLVPGATAGLIREVILADAGSTDATEAVGDIAGCHVLTLPGPLGPRLAQAAEAARGPWLMFIRPGAVLDRGWETEVAQFVARAPERLAAVFAVAPTLQGQTSFWQDFAVFWRARRAALRPERGLLIAKACYREIGGHAEISDPEPDLMQRLGRKRVAALRSGVTLDQSGLDT